MYAVIAHGGTQYRVAPGERVRVEHVAGQAGDTVEFTDLRLVAEEGPGGSLRLGQALTGAKVVATVLTQDRDTKVVIFKKKRCKQYRRTAGHRQSFTEVRVERIV
jgi:large subunit ribosomal protein L21